MKSFYLILTIFLFGGYQAISQLRPQQISQSVYHEIYSNECASGNYDLQLIVSYSVPGGGSSVMSSAITNLPEGSTSNLTVNIPGGATVLSKKIRITTDNGVFVYDLATNDEDYHEHPYGLNWINCINTDYIHIADFGDTFHFSFTSIVGL
jgi:hypothetical protein